MKVGSLFSGIGGIELGFEQQGFKTEWFVECEPYAQAILRKRFPDTKIYGDITKLDFRTVPKVDILTGGFPCQDISIAGKRAGITGSRSSLWNYYYEAIRVLRPQVAFIENVSALLGRGLNVVLADLAKVGYDAEWHSVSASSVGALHRRDRLFIISYPHSLRFSEQSPSGQGGDFQEQACPETLQCSKNVSNSNGTRFQTPPSELSEKRADPITPCSWQIGAVGEGCWSTEPNVGRVAHGVPNRAHRIKCLGNAVVPQVAEVFAKAIKEQQPQEGGLI